MDAPDSKRQLVNKPQLKKLEQEDRSSDSERLEETPSIEELESKLSSSSLYLDQIIELYKLYKQVSSRNRRDQNKNARDVNPLSISRTLNIFKYRDKYALNHLQILRQGISEFERVRRAYRQMQNEY